jgi:hypothetical protein
MDLKEIGFEDVNWIHMAQDRDPLLAPVGAVITLRLP